jgi:hypothetical protein
MAKNPKAPVDVTGGGLPPYVKRSSLSPEQGNQAAARTGFYDRTEWMEPEQGQKLAPAQPKPPVQAWGNGSYDARNGRAARVDEMGANQNDRARARTSKGNQRQEVGRHTEGKQGEVRRPGRW